METTSNTVPAVKDELNNQEMLELTLRSVFQNAWQGVKSIRLRIPVTLDSDGVKESSHVLCRLDSFDMSEIFKFLRRGINRCRAEEGLEPLFTRIVDSPDPEAEFDRQLFDMKADLLEDAKDARRDGKTDDLLKIIDRINKIQDSNRRRVTINKIDLKLAVALAKTFDPDVTEDRVIEILNFERRRMGK